MRFVAVTTSFPRDHEDHAGRFVFDLHAGLREEGHEVLTLCPAAAGSPEAEEGEAGSVVRLRYADEGHEDLFYGDGLERNWRRARSARAKLGTFLRAARRRLEEESAADVLLAHWLWPSGVAAVAAGRSRRRPVLGVGHGGDLHLLARPVLGRLLARGLRGGFAGAMCTSRRGAEIARGRLGVRAVAVAPMGADPARFHPGAGPRIAGWPDGCLLGVGRLVELKGFDLLVRAAAALGRPVVIAGDGPEKEHLRALADAVGADLLFAGRLGPSDVARAMASAAAVVVPSRVLPTGRTEGLPVVVVEALLCGAPVVAAAVGGIPDLVPREALFTPGDQGSLESVLAAVLRRGRDRRPAPPGCTRRETARTLLSLIP